MVPLETTGVTVVVVDNLTNDPERFDSEARVNPDILRQDGNGFEFVAESSH